MNELRRVKEAVEIIVSLSVPDCEVDACGKVIDLLKDQQKKITSLQTPKHETVDELRELYEKEWWEKMSQGGIQGHWHFIWEHHEKDYTEWLENKLLSINTPKHETVEECKTPDQPIVFAEDGCIRFMQNKIVDRLLDISTEAGYSLNEISIDQQIGEYRIEDYKQLMQLIGYSVSGYGDLNEVSHEEACKFDEMAEKLASGKPEIKE